MTTMRRVSLLGATGSIGDSALDVVARHPGRYAVEALAANRNAAKMAALCRRFRPAVAAMLDPEAARTLERELDGAGLRTRVVAGAEGLAEVATLPSADTVVAAIVGAAGLGPTLAAARGMTSPKRAAHASPRGPAPAARRTRDARSVRTPEGAASLGRPGGRG